VDFTIAVAGVANIWLATPLQAIWGLSPALNYRGFGRVQPGPPGIAYRCNRI
jgi:hypothetical protein